jgi:hypothetical protein
MVFHLQIVIFVLLAGDCWRGRQPAVFVSGNQNEFAWLDAGLLISHALGAPHQIRFGDRIGEAEVLYTVIDGK